MEGNTVGLGAELSPGLSEPDESVHSQSARGVRMELDYLLPQGHADVGPRVAEWFTAVVDRVAGEFVSHMPADGLPSKVLRDPEGGPFGPPGTAWCSLLVIGQGQRRMSTSLLAWSPKNWERFLSKAPELSVEMSVKYSTLNQFGHAGAPSLTVSAYRPRPREGRQWLRLDATYVAGTVGDTDPLPDEVSQRWLGCLLDQAALYPAVSGYLADDVFGAGSTRTPLESRLGTFPTDTLPLAESQLRGYSWATVTSAGVLERLGGTEVVKGSGAFAQVNQLPWGGAVLQATQRLAEYEGDAVRRVFDALRPVLPNKKPQPDPFNRFKLIYEAPQETPDHAVDNP